MEPGNDRRTVLRLALAIALAPSFAARASAVTPGSRFDPPLDPMSFTRRLERNLPDGGRLVVGRTFAVRFAPEMDGWSLGGEQVDVAVDFPERLAAFAALERQRKETALFPLRLDRHGLIVGGPDANPARELDKAVAIARQRVHSAVPDSNERKELDAFMQAIQQAGGEITSLLPRDLFAPSGGPFRSQRQLPLPGGGEGTIEVSFTAVADPDTGLMRRARREIVTTIAADSRLTREQWTLARI